MIELIWMEWKLRRSNRSLFFNQHFINQPNQSNKSNFFDLIELVVVDGWWRKRELVAERPFAACSGPHFPSISLPFNWRKVCFPQPQHAPSSFIHKLIPLISSFCLRAGPPSSSTLFLLIELPIRKSNSNKERSWMSGGKKSNSSALQLIS